MVIARMRGSVQPPQTTPTPLRIDNPDSITVERRSRRGRRRLRGCRRRGSLAGDRVAAPACSRSIDSRAAAPRPTAAVSSTLAGRSTSANPASTTRRRRCSSICRPRAARLVPTRCDASAKAATPISNGSRATASRTAATRLRDKTNFPPDGHWIYYSGNEKLPAFSSVAKPAPRGHRTLTSGFGGKLHFERLRASALARGVRLHAARAGHAAGRGRGRSRSRRRGQRAPAIALVAPHVNFTRSSARGARSTASGRSARLPSARRSSARARSVG